jgi:hypothetical protein
VIYSILKAAETKAKGKRLVRGVLFECADSILGALLVHLFDIEAAAAVRSSKNPTGRRSIVSSRCTFLLRFDDADPHVNACDAIRSIDSSPLHHPIIDRLTLLNIFPRTDRCVITH